MSVNMTTCSTDVGSRRLASVSADFDYEGALKRVEPEVLRHFGKDMSRLVCWSADALLASARDARYDDIAKSIVPLSSLASCLGITPLQEPLRDLALAAAAKDSHAVMAHIGDVLLSLSTLMPMLARHGARKSAPTALV